MPEYRKKPLVIEARQHPQYPDQGTGSIDDWTTAINAWEANGTSIIDWINGDSPNRSAGWEGDCISIETLEGTMLASPGDFIIKGVKGEFYPCKPDIFKATYDLTEDWLTCERCEVVRPWEEMQSVSEHDCIYLCAACIEVVKQQHEQDHPNPSAP